MCGQIRDVSYLDVGYQSCSYVGTVSLTVQPNVSRVYLFVKGESPLQTVVLPGKSLLLALDGLVHHWLRTCT